MVNIDIKKKIVSTVGHYEKALQDVHEENSLLRASFYESLELFEKYLKSPQEKQNIDHIRVYLKEDKPSKTLEQQFSQSIQAVIASVMKSLGEMDSKNLDNITDADDVIKMEVNASLSELIKNLAIPKELDKKAERIQKRLKEVLDKHQLKSLIDDLTALVEEAFIIEKKRYMGFLQQFGDQLNDFEMYLQAVSNQNQHAQKESDKLQSAVDVNLTQISKHLSNSKTIEELSDKVSENLSLIRERVKTYREHEAKRIVESEQQITELQAKLDETEKEAKEMKKIVFDQTYNVYHDGLTGIPNRRAYNEQIVDVYHRWKRNGAECIVAICDIDHFKKINDSYGHLAGDKVLRKIAVLFKSLIRSEDFVARYGGEEFVFIFENTSKHKALKIAEDLRKEVESCPFYYKEEPVPVKISFGVTNFLEDDDIDSVFARADCALYEAKRNGRNQVVIL